jgi:hypothetical protein
MPALDLNFAANRSLPADYGPTPSFSRASTGTFFNSSGVLTSAAVNVPRFDHILSGGSWVSRGLLMEEQRTNLFTYSNTFSNGAWNKVRGPVTQSITSPDGTANAWQMDCNETGGGHYAYITPSGASTSGFYTISVFAKKGNNGIISLQMADSSYANYVTRYFDLTNGTTTGTATLVGNYSSVSAAITNVGNGWYWCSLTANKGSGNGITASVGFSNNDTGGFCTSGQYNYFFNAQLEFGAFATSAIATTASSVTRSIDVCEMPAGVVTNFFNPSEGTLVVEFDTGIPGSITKAAEIVAFADSTNNNRMFFDFYTPDNAYRWYVDETPTGVSSSLKPGPYVANYTTQKAAMCYKLNDLAISLNGATPLTDTSQPLPININRMEIGYNTPAAGANRYTGHFSRIRYYPVRLTNAQLQSLST